MSVYRAVADTQGNTWRYQVSDTAAMIAFAKARLDEDEAVAKAACYVWPADFEVTLNPARVLREVEAKRAILGRSEAVHAAFTDRTGGLWPDVSRRERSHAYATLCDLIAVWSDHPDYQVDWKP